MSPVVLEPPRVLVVRRRGLAEVLLATPLLRVLRACHPQAEVTVVTDRQWVPLLAENPRIDTVVGVGRGDSLRMLARPMKLRPFTHMFDFEQSAWSARLRWCLPGPWTRGGIHPRQRWLLHLTGRSLAHQERGLAEQYLAAAGSLGLVADDRGVELFLDQASRVRARRWLEQAGLGQDRPYVVLAPTSPHLVRRWPLESWTQLMRKLLHLGSDVVVVGGPDEAATASEVALRGGARAGSAAGDLDLLSSAALIAGAQAAICVDNGMAHVAAGVGTPVIALNGPTVRAHGTYPWHAHGAVMERELDCRPCGTTGNSACPQRHHACLVAIRPNHVVTTLNRLLPPVDEELLEAGAPAEAPTLSPSRWSYLPG